MYVFGATRFSSSWYVREAGDAGTCSPSSTTSCHSAAFETVSILLWLTMALSRPFQGYSSSALGSFYVYTTYLFRVIECVEFLDLCSRVVSQAPQHFRSSETQSTLMVALLAWNSVWSVSSRYLGMSMTVHLQEDWKVNVERCHFYASLIVLFHVRLRVASSLCPWGWWCV